MTTAIRTQATAPTVLVVDDDEDSRAMLTTVLECEGYRVVSAANGAEALSVVATTMPCAIVLDLMMPVMDGQRFRESQIRDPAIAHIPVILISAHHDAPAMARRLNATACLPKPIDFDALSCDVARLCKETITRSIDSASAAGLRSSLPCGPQPESRKSR
jgi:CheY-like chemotaxis protein